MRHRPGLDKAAVVRAAAELVNAEGPEALALGRLAERLDIQTPSLYNHIDGLPGLQRDLAVLGTHELGERLATAAIGKSGLQALAATAQAYREYVKENPGVYQYSVRSAANVQPVDPDLQAAQERVIQISLAVVGSFGLQGEEALHALRGLRSLVHGFATLETAGGFGLPLDCDESFRRLIEMFGRELEGLQ